MFTGNVPASYSPEMSLAVTRSALVAATSRTFDPSPGSGGASKSLTMPMPDGPLRAATTIGFGAAEAARALSAAAATIASLMKALVIEVLRRHDTAGRWPFSMAWAIFKNVTCVQCGEREALVFIRRRGEGGEGCDMALCESCAKGRGISAGKGSLELSIDDLIGDNLESPPGPGAGAFCPSCGLDVATLRREGRLGCAGCADAFFDEISKAVGRGTAGRPSELAIQKGLTASAFSDAEPARLLSELEAAIASED